MKVRRHTCTTLLLATTCAATLNTITAKLV